MFSFLPFDIKPLEDNDLEFWYRASISRDGNVVRFQIRVNPRCYSHELSYLMRLSATLREKLCNITAFMVWAKVEPEPIVMTLQGPRANMMPAIQCVAEAPVKKVEIIKEALRDAGFYETENIYH